MSSWVVNPEYRISRDAARVWMCIYKRSIVLLKVFISNKTKSSYCTKKKKKTCHEETNFLPKLVFGGIRPGPTQTGLYSHRRSLETEISDLGSRGNTVSM